MTSPKISREAAIVLRRALLAITVRLPDGTVCFRTANGIPMQMGVKLERIVRHALRDTEHLG